MSAWRSLSRISLILVVAFVLGSGVAFYRSITSRPSHDDSSITFIVKPGDGPRIVAAGLKSQGLLENDRSFYIYILIMNKRNNFYPGAYDLKRNSTIRELVLAMTNSRTKQLMVRIIEGWRITDIANEVAHKTKITSAAFAAAAPVELYEGYLFPDTYYFTPDTTAEQMIQIMRANFDKRTNGLGLTKDDVILASIVEREARHSDDRPKIARVYLNRLKINMPLQADPTVQYAKGNWEPVSLADYNNVRSPYNTYLNQGLPPTPIANPSLKSLAAVKNPATDFAAYLYFLTGPDGKTYYAKTLAEHNANKRK